MGVATTGGAGAIVVMGSSHMGAEEQR